MKCSVSLLVIFFFFQHSYSQCKTYKLDANHDTINCTDYQNYKQGKWVTRVVDNHGEPGYQDEGRYKDDKKEGEWITYNLMGDVIAEENYKWGNKDGVCRYYNLIGLVREESWKAIDPANPYDTIRVYRMDNPDKYDLKIVKVEASSVKHGIWTYYDPERQTIIKTEEYVIDLLVPATTGTKNTIVTDTTARQKTDSTSIANKNKPPEVLEYEKKNSNKKKIKVRDGATGVD
jgi:antitoxin component YwqK of YwqJK toxin-antitoxin module